MWDSASTCQIPPLPSASVSLGYGTGGATAVGSEETDADVARREGGGCWRHRTRDPCPDQSTTAARRDVQTEWWCKTGRRRLISPVEKGQQQLQRSAAGPSTAQDAVDGVDPVTQDAPVGRVGRPAAR